MEPTNSKGEQISEADSILSKETVSLWMSPSDTMLGIVELKPPFTTRYVRGEVHQGILKIGNDLLVVEHEILMNKMNEILAENDEIWTRIINQEKELIKEKATKAQENVFNEKSKVMTDAFFEFYESTLQDFENHMRREHEQLLITTHAEEMSRMNIKIKADLQRERHKLEQELQNEYDTEIRKLKEYYYLLMKREKIRSTELINKATRDRDEALAILYKQMEMKNISESMYIMCSERKKCHIKKFLIQNYCEHIEELEIENLLEKVREIQKLQKVYITPDTLTKQWQDKICNILRLFLRFISYTLKLIPEQSEFLLLFEKMVIMQLNQVIKIPSSTHSTLLDEAESENKFKFFDNATDNENKFEATDDTEIAHRSEKKPFVIYGDFTKPPERVYGSRETLPLDVDLPVIIIDKKHYYAKCHIFEDIKLTLKCLCKKSIETVCRCAQRSLTSLRLLECECNRNVQDICRCGAQGSTPSSLSLEIESENMESPEASSSNSEVEPKSKKKREKRESNTIGEQEEEGAMPHVYIKPCPDSCTCPCKETTESQSTIDYLALAGLKQIDYCPNRKCNHWLKLVPSHDNTLDFDFDPVKYRNLINEFALKTLEHPLEPKFDETLPIKDHFVVPEEESHKNVDIQCSIGYLPDDDDCLCPCCEVSSEVKN